MTRHLEDRGDRIWIWPSLADIPPVFVNIADFDPNLSQIPAQHRTVTEELQSIM